MTNTTQDLALLAPVPLEHLLDGAEVCASQGKVAFGSRAWDVFRELDTLRSGHPVDVYIYPSRANEPPHFEIRWRARYVRQVDSVGGAHPDGMRYRPRSTTTWAGDNEGYWAVFWEVEELRELPETERIPIRDLRGFQKSPYYGRAFVPEGPLLIERP